MATSSSVPKLTEAFDKGVSVLVLPENLTYGCICQGFVYQLKVTILNKGNRPQYFRVFCNPKVDPRSLDQKTNPAPKIIYEPRSVASGLSISFIIEMRAELAIYTLYELEIVESINRSTITKDISALVVPLDVFKKVSKAAELQDMSLYRNGVRPVSTAVPVEEFSLISGGGPDAPPPSIASIISEALMDVDDIEELSELPMTPNLYFDPFEKCLKIDEQLGRVVVDSKWSVEESEKQTKIMRDKRLKELEEQGYYTVRTIARFAEAKTTMQTSGSVVFSDIGGQSMIESHYGSKTTSHHSLHSGHAAPEDTAEWHLPPIHH